MQIQTFLYKHNFNPKNIFYLFLDRDILDNIKINQYASQFTIINGYDGSVMINTTDSILNFGYYNTINYTNGMFAHYILNICQIIIYVMSDSN